ncbi:uncharacterized protein LOC133718367 [Rosa rugosa]|uniref:uncharacterized protein LOC133718367 n=1 Tax=Rosa rugosa TaxID=74645 RepID=UPI002B40CD11|nr:uncharacterized protein LOC133718367 [Rosa rugosa]
MVDKVSEFSQDQEERFLYYVSVAEELAKELSSSNGKLKSLIDDLRNEVDSIRTFRNEHSTEYQKLLMEEEQMAEELKLCLEIGKDRFQSQAYEPTFVGSIKEVHCTDFQRSSFDEKCIESIKLLMDEKQKAEESLKIEKEMTRSQANELASLRSALNEKCTEWQELLREEKVKAEKLMLLLEIEKERTQADELASIRSIFDEKCVEYQKLLMDERQKVEDSMRLLKIQKVITQSEANQLAFRSATDEFFRKENQASKKLLEVLEAELKDVKNRELCTCGQVSGATNKRKREKNEKEEEANNEQ